MATDTDISGVPLPTASATNGGIADRVIAVPPVRDVPNEQAIEFMVSAYGSLAAGGAVFVSLTDPTTGLAFSDRVDPQYRGRVDSILLYCPDMVAAAAPYLYASLQIGGQLAPAWGLVPVYPRDGAAALSFDTVIDLPPNQVIGIAGKNTDAVNTHFLAVYLHGWFWPKDIVEG